MPNVSPKPKKQVAALPVMVDPEDGVRLLLITSRETKRFILPKGWPMKGKKDFVAAAIEAEQEAGVVGHPHRKPIGRYTYWKRRDGQFDLCRVRVFLLEVETQLATWREQDQRKLAWLTVDDAAELVDEPGLAAIIRDLPKIMKKRCGRRSRRPAGQRPIVLPDGRTKNPHPG